MSLSKKKISLLREFVDHTCESCHKHEKECGHLEPHRIRPGAESGTYNLRNILLVCKACHKIFTSAQNQARGIC